DTGDERVRLPRLLGRSRAPEQQEQEKRQELTHGHSPRSGTALFPPPVYPDGRRSQAIASPQRSFGRGAEAGGGRTTRKVEASQAASLSRAARESEAGCGGGAQKE